MVLYPHCHIVCRVHFFCASLLMVSASASESWYPYSHCSQFIRLVASLFPCPLCQPSQACWEAFPRQRRSWWGPSFQAVEQMAFILCFLLPYLLPYTSFNGLPNGILTCLVRTWDLLQLLGIRVPGREIWNPCSQVWHLSSHWASML